MLDFDLKRSVKLFKRFLLSPSEAFKDMSAVSDLGGSLFVLDALSFFTVVGTVIAGGLPFVFSFSFFLQFLKHKQITSSEIITKIWNIIS